MDTTYINGGEYTFTMPAENTEVKAVYKKVAVKVTVLPSSCNINVVEERTGNQEESDKNDAGNGSGWKTYSYLHQ